MANPRHPSRSGAGPRPVPHQGLLPLDETTAAPRARLRWPLIALAAVAGLLALAWIDGGEEPLRPIAESVPLPEPQP
jgi:hypothetical protein